MCLSALYTKLVMFMMSLKNELSVTAHKPSGTSEQYDIASDTIARFLQGYMVFGTQRIIESSCDCILRF